jgi:3-hydroxyisobutyrate dehydrogenase-like beta-hydroxyacid dehydrogenase
MGAALAGAFLAREYPLAVWNRTASKTEPLAARGARVAATVAEAVETAEVVVVNVSDYGASDGLLRDDEVTKRLHGKLLVQLTSGTPREGRETAAWAARHGIDYLDGAIMATPGFVGTPECTILYAGSGEQFEKYQPVLAALGGNAHFLGGDAGHASALDTALLTSLWGALFGALQGVSVARAEGLELEIYRGAVHGFLPIVDELVVDMVDRIGAGRFEGDQATIETCREAIRILTEIGEEHGIDRSVPDAFDRIFRMGIEAGIGQEDFSALSTIMQTHRNTETQKHRASPTGRV